LEIVMRSPRLFAVTLAIMSVAVTANSPAAPANDPGPFSVAQAQSDLQSKIQTLIDKLRGVDMPAGIVKTNGRIEATQIDIAAKYPGRLESVAVEEGDEVKAGQVIAIISSPEYEAQLRGAQAQVLRAKQALAEAEAMIAERQSDQVNAKTDLERAKDLVQKGFMAQQVYDQRLNKAQVTDAALRAAQAAREQAQFQINTAQSEVERIEAILVDLKLVAPRSGRVQYKISQAGEVVAAGTRIVTLLDLHDVYMTIYLPAAEAGQLALGDEARIIIDPAPQYVIPASISFVATEAQFTPKSVETADERQKLMFRIKLQIDPKVLEQYHTQVKTGIRGIGFVRTDTATAWPADLVVKLPQ
jgi:HlyD family secretion protein